MLRVMSAISAILLCFSMAMAKESSDEKTPLALSGQYFGQKLPVGKAEVFARGTISFEGRYEFALSFSPDGSELLFTAQVPDEQIYVYYTHLEEGKWTKPSTVNLSKGARKSVMEAFFSPDGKYIYFAPYDEGMDVRIWSIEVRKDGWHNPREVEAPVSEDPAFFPTTSMNGVLYYTNLAKRKVYRAYMERGSVSRVEDAGLAFGMHPFVAPDESCVLVDAMRDDGFGKGDIYVAFRTDDGRWTKPVGLGGEVNTEFAETCPTLSPDRKYLFFSRYNEPNEVSNIYWISSRVIEDARRRLSK